MKAAEVIPIPDIRRVDARFVVDQLIATPDTTPESLLASVALGPHIAVPDYMDGKGGVGDRLVLPSLEVRTFRGSSALLVDLHTSDSRLQGFYRDTARSRKDMGERLKAMAFASAVKILDTNGAEGLHHVHGNSYFPNTLYFETSRGNGVRPHVFMTRIGEFYRDGMRIPVLGLVTATKDVSAERKFINLVGGR